MEGTGSSATSGAVSYRDYGYSNAKHGCQHDYLVPVLGRLANLGPGVRVLDVGCGNGFVSGWLLSQGCTVVGVDPSESGIEIARRSFPGGRFEALSAGENLLVELGEAAFDLVISTEVIEHVYDPFALATGCFRSLRSGGAFLCSTPYHGYVKNLAIAAAGRFDKHVDPLWVGGHIRFWSRNTLFRLLEKVGFTQLDFAGAGRVPLLWKSMIVKGVRP